MPLFTPIATNYAIPSGAQYVSTTGAYSAAGTSSAPTNLQGAYDKLPASGGTIVMRGGKYRELVQNIYKPVTIQAYPGETVVLDGAKSLTGAVVDGSDFRFDGYTIVLPAAPSGMYPAGREQMNNNHNVFLNEVQLTQVKTRSELGLGKFYVDLTAQKLYLRDNPSGKVVEAVAKNRSLNIGTGAKGSKFLGINITRYVDAIGTNSVPDVLFENCTSSWSSMYGLSVYRTDRAIVRNCNVSHNGVDGIIVSGEAADAIFANNTCQYNNEFSSPGTYSCANFKIHLQLRATVSGNIFSDSIGEGNGLWVDVNNKDCLFIDNHIYNNQLGIFDEICQHNSYIGNYVYNNRGSGILTQGSRFSYFANNTVVNNMGLGQFKIGDSNRRASTHADQANSEGGWIQFAAIVVGNIIVAPSNTQAFYVDAYGSDVVTSYIERIEQNQVYLSGTGRYASWEVGGVRTNYITVEDFRAGVSGYGLTDKTYTGTTNPFFANAAPDFTLKPGSAAIGSVVGGDAIALRVAPGYSYDAGAFQTTKVSGTTDCTVPVQNAVAPLNSQISSLNGQVSSLTSDKATLTGQVSSLTADKTALTGQVSSLTADKTALTAQVSSLNADKASLTSQIAAKQVTIDDLNARLSVAVADKNTALADRAAIQAELTLAYADMTLLQASLSNLQAALDYAQSELATGSSALKASFQADLALIAAQLPGYTEVVAAKAKYQ